MAPEGADAVLAALPASEADMPATKDFVRAEINDIRNEMSAGFARVDTNLKDLRVEMHDVPASMRRWIVATGIALGGLLLAAVNTLPS